MKTNPDQINMSITFRYAAGNFKTVPYQFKNKEAYLLWLEKANNDQSKRKIEKQSEVGTPGPV